MQGISASLSRSLFCGGALAAGMVDGIFSGEDDLRDGNKGVALLKKGLDNSGQGFRGVECRIVKQNNGPRLDLGRHPLYNLRSF